MTRGYAIGLGAGTQVLTHLPWFVLVGDRPGELPRAVMMLRARGASPYVSPSLVWSLDSEWRSGALTEVGFRGRLFRRVNGRLGAAVLTTLDRQVRVNPTVGLDVRLGAGRSSLALTRRRRPTPASRSTRSSPA